MCYSGRGGALNAAMQCNVVFKRLMSLRRSKHVELMRLQKQEEYALSAEQRCPSASLAPARCARQQLSA